KPRAGAPAPRVAEASDGIMLNAVGLANPGLDEVKRVELPWLAQHAGGARVLVNVVGDTVEDYATVVSALTDQAGVDVFELNVSCPNVRAGWSSAPMRRRSAQWCRGRARPLRGRSS